ncbi:hypothetical protein SLH46_21485 [Draconibacterium sp. IB214405]|uniref:hypothetical protein n=1 Tax=Draconibacterium sp. IB214405 TaxID=3097352 RepID=UPI002A1148C3|nr:hypothetical protein [Draconibacterium sp. IB214405]MDX8341786.1 hypothetical protein [Draconibacterium sp. IB214405]
MKINKIALLVTVIIPFFTFCSPQQETTQENSWEYYKIIGDSVLLNVNEEDNHVYLQTEQGSYKCITGESNWDEDYLSIINIVIDRDVLIFVESPYSESGDWNNKYTSYYDAKGNLKALIRKSSFFNGVCRDGVITEKEIYSLEANKLQREQYEIYDENMNSILDTSECVFNYRFKFDFFGRYEDIPIVKELDLYNE